MTKISYTEFLTVPRSPLTLPAGRIGLWVSCRG